MRVKGIGTTKGRRAEAVVELIDRYDEQTGFTAMQRLTGWHGSILLIAAVNGMVRRGVVSVELALPGRTIVTECRRRGFAMTDDVTGRLLEVGEVASARTDLYDRESQVRRRRYLPPMCKIGSWAGGRAGDRRAARADSRRDVSHLGRGARSRWHTARYNRAQLGTPWGATHLTRVALVDTGRLLATAKRYELSGRVDGQPVKMLGLGAVFTPESERGHGHAGTLLRRVLDDAAAGGVRPGACCSRKSTRTTTNASASAGSPSTRWRSPSGPARAWARR